MPLLRLELKPSAHPSAIDEGPQLIELFNHPNGGLKSSTRTVEADGTVLYKTTLIDPDTSITTIIHKQPQRGGAVSLPWTSETIVSYPKDDSSISTYEEHTFNEDDTVTTLFTATDRHGVASTREAVRPLVEFLAKFPGAAKEPESDSDSEEEFWTFDFDSDSSEDESLVKDLSLNAENSALTGGLESEDESEDPEDDDNNGNLESTISKDDEENRDLQPASEDVNENFRRDHEDENEEVCNGGLEIDFNDPKYDLEYVSE
ncbi:hypothetical protein DFP72DRAFT_844759 [Ephemerocybe angulata]|uniref:Uncharacterized protein n=1 Tax=Ephemerocybe angulata TaxID=980116 RepID=A0A8H6MBF5_9AGAR|nr:hypothetical protein DFP72DRAFT_844759 [Tulosesus angulatus]